MMKDCEDVLWIILDLQGIHILESSGRVRLYSKICLHSGLYVKEKGLFLIMTDKNSVW